MADHDVLSPEHVTLVDTNVFVSTGNPGTSKYRQFRTAVNRAGVVLLVPSRVETEIVQSGVEPALDRARQEGWAQIVAAPPVSHGDATTARDIAHRTIASKTPEKEEHTVEKTDAVFAGIAIEYLRRDEGGIGVTVITADSVAREAIETAIASLGYDNEIYPVSLWEIIGEGDDLRIL